MSDKSMKLRQGTAQEAGMSPERVRYAASLAEGWVAQGIHPALVVLVARKGIVVQHEAFGRLTPEPGAPPLQLDTIFPLASVTKPITATAVMMLVEDGLLGLYRPVVDYIPEFVGQGKNRVMVHNLLTHTSGLRDEDVKAHAEKKKDSVNIPPLDENQHPQIHKKLWLRYDAPLWKPPGEEMSYCNTGYEIAAEIVRRISGKSFDEFTKQKVFDPLGMKDTNLILPDEHLDRLVHYPKGNDYGKWIEEKVKMRMPSGAGGLFSSTKDIATFCQMHLNGGEYDGVRILSPVTTKFMARNHVPGISSQKGDEFFPEASWGLGWNILGTKEDRGSLQSVETYCHGGAGGICVWIDPIYDVVGVYFSVDGTCNPSEYMNAVHASIVDA